MAAPSLAGAGVVDGLVDGVGDTVNGALGGGGGGGGAAPAPQPAPAPQSGSGATYVPPAHGDNPHAQGTSAVLDTFPEQTTPLPYEQDGGSEDLVVGRSRGEQNPDGSYRGRVTVASVAPLGMPIAEIGIDTEEGESESGPSPEAQMALDALCDGSGNQVCLGVLEAESSTDEKGSSNSFSAARAQLGGQSGITASALTSNGDMNADERCQTATADSSVADASVLGLANASVIDSESESVACDDGSQAQDNESSVIGINSIGVPVPNPGCANGTPDSVTSFIFVDTVCNADDSTEAGDSQLEDPYGVREGLTVTVQPLLLLGGAGGGGPVLLGTTAASETHAVAPPAKPPEPECPDPGNPACDRTAPPDKREGTSPVGPAGPGGPSADSPDRDTLAFTGTDVLTLGLIGLSIMGTGLGLMALADRRRLARA